MEKFKVLADQLVMLADLCDSADDEFKKASIFSASHTIKSYFLCNEIEVETTELISSVEYISCVVGYENSDGHNPSQCKQWALTSAQTFRNSIVDRYEL
jgi:hypothetical protein